MTDKRLNCCANTLALSQFLIQTSLNTLGPLKGETEVTPRLRANGPDQVKGWNGRESYDSGKSTCLAHGLLGLNPEHPIGSEFCQE